MSGNLDMRNLKKGKNQTTRILTTCRLISHFPECFDACQKLGKNLYRSKVFFIFIFIGQTTFYILSRVK